MGWVVHLGCQGQTITEPAIGGPGSPCGLALPLKPLPTIHLSVINHSHPLRESLKKKKRRVNNKISLKLTTVYIHTGTRQEEIHNVKLQHEHNIKVCNTYCWYNIEKKNFSSLCAWWWMQKLFVFLAFWCLDAAHLSSEILQNSLQSCALLNPAGNVQTTLNIK